MIVSRLARVFDRFMALPARINRLQEALGRIEQRQILQMGVEELTQSEFRVFSQWGEDGIVQYLIQRVPLERRIFVEFGVENYTESNTRFLLVHDHWSGLVIDGSATNVSDIKRDPIYWACNLKAEHAFVTSENIDQLLAAGGIAGDIGLLSIDIDGNDYWIWHAIGSITPRIVICEYNSHFGPTAQVSTPYDPAFVRASAHFSKIYYGASIAALNSLAIAKGYSLVGGNSAGNNAFFVRNDVLGRLRAQTPAEAYRQAQFREFHDEQGKLTFDDFPTRLRKIAHLPVFDLTTQSVRPIAAIREIGVG